MNKVQVFEVFKVIQSMYPRFMPDEVEDQQKKLDVWAKLMRDMDYDRVMKKTEEHITESKFPPTLAEITAYAPEEDNNQKQLEEWRKEAAKVSQETKDRFQNELRKLTEAKTHDQ